MCPDRETLAAYVDRRLPAIERDRLEAHLAACDSCRAEAVGIWRLAKPRRLPQFRPARARWGWAVAASVAASALLALGLSLRRPAPPRIEPSAPEAARHVPEAPPEPKPKPPEPPKPPPPVAPREGTKVPDSFVPPPKPPPTPPPPPEGTKVPDSFVPPEAPKPTAPTTVAAIAVLERGTLVNGAAAQAGQPIRPDDLLSGAALVAFPDQTRIELEGGTLRIASPERLLLDQGAVKAAVKHPLVIETPHGSARVLGTVLRIQVDTLTRLEVEEGRVELRTKTRSITVGAGKSATSSAMSLKALPKEECVFSAPKHEGTPLILPLDQLRVRGDEVLSFDYWVDPQAAQVNLHFWNSTRKLKHETVVTETAFGKWTRAVIKVADLGLREGDHLGNLFIQGTGGGARQFYVDKLQLTRPYSLRPR